MPFYLFRLLQYTAETSGGIIGNNQRMNTALFYFLTNSMVTGKKLTQKKSENKLLQNVTL
jgi:hypothetical protein